MNEDLVMFLNPDSIREQSLLQSGDWYAFIFSTCFRLHYDRFEI